MALSLHLYGVYGIITGQKIYLRGFMTNKNRRRFIAGATCPNCKAMDTIMLYFENNMEKLKCVECDYQETQTDEKVKASSRENEDVIGIFKPE